VNATVEISALPAKAARMLAVEILLADPETLGDDVLESCLYLLREKLRTPRQPTAKTGKPPPFVREPVRRTALCRTVDGTTRHTTAPLLKWPLIVLTSHNAGRTGFAIRGPGRLKRRQAFLQPAGHWFEPVPPTGTTSKASPPTYGNAGIEGSGTRGPASAPLPWPSAT
jgi:hypothetical protein